MKNQVAKSLLAIGLSLSIINCGGAEEAPGQESDLEIKVVSVQDLDVGVEIGSKSVGNDEVAFELVEPIEQLPDAEDAEAKVALSHVIVGDMAKPILVKAMGPDVSDEVGNYQIIAVSELEPIFEVNLDDEEAENTAESRVDLGNAKFHAVKAAGLSAADDGVTFELAEAPELEAVIQVESEGDEEGAFDLSLVDSAQPVELQSGLRFPALESPMNHLDDAEEHESVSEQAFWRAAQDVQGIYELEEHRMNLESCEAEGAEELEGGDRFALVKALKMLDGTPYLMVVSGESVADAESKLDRIESGRAYRTDFSFVATELGADRIFRGQAGTGGFSNAEGMCDYSVVTDSSLGFSNGRLKIESIKTDVKPYEQNDDGECAIGTALEIANELACSSIESLAGAFIQPL